MLDWGDSGVEKESALLDLCLLTDKVLNLLSEEVVLIDVHVLQLAEVMLKIDYILHDLLECLII